MSIKVRYFASLGERLGRTESDLMFDQTMTVRDIWRQSTVDAGIPENVLAAVNMEYVQRDSAVEDGDVVAFFPPVTGG